MYNMCVCVLPLTPQATAASKIQRLNNVPVVRINKRYIIIMAV